MPAPHPRSTALRQKISRITFSSVPLNENAERARKNGVRGVCLTPAETVNRRCRASMSSTRSTQNTAPHCSEAQPRDHEYSQPARCSQALSFTWLGVDPDFAGAIRQSDRVSNQRFTKLARAAADGGPLLCTLCDWFRAIGRKCLLSAFTVPQSSTYSL